jgi:hypothetical protein
LTEKLRTGIQGDAGFSVLLEETQGKEPKKELKSDFSKILRL